MDVGWLADQLSRLTASEWIAALSSIATLSVAVAVWLSNNAHAQRSHLLVQRASAVEDQKFRLALLDRRLEAISALKVAAGEYGRGHAVTRSMIDQLFAALEVTQTVFASRHEEAISALIMTATHAKQAERSVDREFAGRDGDRVRAALERLSGISSKLSEQLLTLVHALQDDTRITDVPPVAVSSKAPSRYRKQTTAWTTRRRLPGKDK